MFKYIVFSSLISLGYSRPGFVDGVLSLGGDGGEHGGGGDWQSNALYGGGGGDIGGWQGHYAVHEGGGGGGGGHGGGGGSDYIGGDFHEGISVVGIGGGNKGHIFDLTNHASDPGHHGSFGGSFVASSKYSAPEHENGGSPGGHHGYDVNEHGGTGFAGHYSGVLGADEHGGGGGGGYESALIGAGGGDWAGSSGGLGGYH